MNKAECKLLKEVMSVVSSLLDAATVGFTDVCCGRSVVCFLVLLVLQQRRAQVGRGGAFPPGHTWSAQRQVFAVLMPPDDGSTGILVCREIGITCLSHAYHMI